MKPTSADDAMRYVSFATPLGWIVLAASAQGISLLEFCGDTEPSDAQIREIVRKTYSRSLAQPDDGSAPFRVLKEAREALIRYFDRGTPLPDLPLDMRRGTPFQQEVWRALRGIPHGETRSYLEISRAVGRPKAFRAVGGACGSNPVPVFVPCHRVVASGGGLGGFSGGLHIKEALLGIERKKSHGS